jgi:imidazole glycerol-phosphate synthase subunit HisH
MTTNKVVIIDYGMGNIASVAKAIKKIGARVEISSEAKVIAEASHIILPGVGAFGDGMKNLNCLGLVEVLKNNVLINKKPFLGICLGMQLLADKSYEFGEHEGLGWIDGEVVKIQSAELNLPLPHIGWNNIEPAGAVGELFKNIIDYNFYFVHSYHLACAEQDIVTSYCQYGQRFVASLEKDNIFAVQFHPEKSQAGGLKILENFLAYA